MWGMLKNILLIGAVGILSFPILYFGIMFMEGQLRIEKGPAKVVSKDEKVEVLQYSPIQDSMAVVHAKVYESMVEQEKRLQREQRELAKKEERISLLSGELNEKEKDIEKSRREIEEIVKKNETLEEKKIKSLARIYESMRPEEAASIMSSLPDKLVVTIFKAMTEDRQKAKILEKMNREQAARLSRQLGDSVFQKPLPKELTKANG